MRILPQRARELCSLDGSNICHIFAPTSYHEPRLLAAILFHIPCLFGIVGTTNKKGRLLYPKPSIVTSKNTWAVSLFNLKKPSIAGPAAKTRKGLGGRGVDPRRNCEEHVCMHGLKRCVPEVTTQCCM